MKDYVECLNDMYDSYYCKSDGRCKYYDECKSSIDEENKFYSDRVKVGENYGKIIEGKSIPKIIFCGLEGVHDGFHGEAIPEINMNNKNSMPSLEECNPHYRGVRYVLSYILSGLEGKTKPNSAKMEDLRKEEYKEYLKSFCLTNIYHCAFGNKGKKSGLPHSKQMKNHCQEIFFEEIDILEPNLVVIQAISNVPNTLWKNMKSRYPFEKEIARAKRNDNTSLYLLKNKNDKPFLCLWTYHGRGFPYGGKNDSSDDKSFFVNNSKYIQDELNPVLNTTIDELKRLACIY